MSDAVAMALEETRNDFCDSIDEMMNEINDRAEEENARFAPTSRERKDNHAMRRTLSGVSSSSDGSESDEDDPDQEAESLVSSLFCEALDNLPPHSINYAILSLPTFRDLFEPTDLAVAEQDVVYFKDCLDKAVARAQRIQEELYPGKVVPKLPHARLIGGKRQREVCFIDD